MPDYNSTPMRISSKNVEVLVGLQARIWHYSVSHGVLMVRVRDSLDVDWEDTHELQFVHCKRICVDHFWDIVNPTFIMSGDQAVYTDNTTAIHCDGVSLIEGVERGV